MEANVGTVKQVMGPVLDVEFASGKLPAIYNALTLTNPSINDQKDNLVLEVAKHLGENTVRCIAMDATEGVRRGAVVTVTVTSIEDGGIEVEHEGMKAFIRRSDLSRDRAEQRPDRFSVGDKVDARVTNVDAKARRLGLSIKALQIAEEREAVEQFGSSDSGASLGDILGAALKQQGDN